MAMTISGGTPNFPGITHMPSKVWVPPCRNETKRHQFYPPEVLDVRKPFYCLGSFCTMTKIQTKCALCEYVRVYASLQLGDISISGDWPEDLE
jgi:hypothetical protein